MASTIRKDVTAGICRGIHDRMSAAQQAGLLWLLEERDADADLTPQKRCLAGSGWEEWIANRAALPK